MFGSDVAEAAKRHAISTWPKESVGYVIDGRYIGQPNISADPMREFIVDPAAWSPEVDAVIHSHPVHSFVAEIDPRAPSREDMASQRACSVPWGILATDGQQASDLLSFGDHLLNEPLIGRQFIPNVMDCYELMRAYVHQTHNRQLPAVPRDALWWEKGQNVLVEHLPKFGFFGVSIENAREGDGLLFAFPANGVINHCAVLLDNGLMLHHRRWELSRREPWSAAWRRLTRMVVRKRWP